MKVNGIKKVDSSIRIAEVPSVAGAMIAHWEESGAVAKNELLKIGFDELSSLTKTAISTLNSEKSKSNMDELDRALDASWTALGTGLEGHAALQKGEGKEAALSLLDLYARHGGKATSRANFASESATIASALDELSSEKAQANVKKLGGIAEAIEELSAAHKAFQDAFNAASSATAAGKSEKSSSDLKKDILRCINDKILPFVSAAAALDNATYGTFAAVLGEDVERANAAVSKRASGKK